MNATNLNFTKISINTPVPQGTNLLQRATLKLEKKKNEERKKGASNGLERLIKLFSAQTEALNYIGIDLIDHAKALDFFKPESHTSDDALEQIRIALIQGNGKYAIIRTLYRLDTSGERNRYVPVSQEWRKISSKTHNPIIVGHQFRQHMISALNKRNDQRNGRGLKFSTPAEISKTAKRARVKKLKEVKAHSEEQLQLLDQRPKILKELVGCQATSLLKKPFFESADVWQG